MSIIVASSNYADESYCETIKLRYVHPFIAKIYYAKLNKEIWSEDDTYYNVRDDDYVPWRGMYDLVGEDYPHNN